MNEGKWTAGNWILFAGVVAGSVFVFDPFNWQRYRSAPAQSEVIVPTKRYEPASYPLRDDGIHVDGIHVDRLRET